MAHALGVLQRPAQGLHAAQATACTAASFTPKRSSSNACAFTQLRRSAPESSSHTPRPYPDWCESAGRRKPGAQVLDADNERTLGVHGFTGANHVVPPSLRFLGCPSCRRPPRGARHYVMANQNGIGFVGIQLPVGLKCQGVVAMLLPLRSGSASGKCMDWGVAMKDIKKPGIA